MYASIKDEDKDVLPGNVYKLLRARYPNSEPDDIFGPDTDYDTGRRLASDFVERSGFRNLPQVCSKFYFMFFIQFYGTVNHV